MYMITIEDLSKVLEDLHKTVELEYKDIEAEVKNRLADLALYVISAKIKKETEVETKEKIEELLEENNN